MSKVAQYLNEHLVGEASSTAAVREYYATDSSVLTIKPEIVAYPRLTNDIRKIARFTWQLAEKGHVLGVTARGQGRNLTGAAVGTGVLIDTAAYLDNVVEVSEKNKRVHVQAGASVAVVNEALRWHKLSLPGVGKGENGTIGGWIAGAGRGQLAGKYGSIGERVEQLEVVLANGDAIETGRVSKKDVNKKKGLQTLEGEIYRKLDGLIDDNSELIGTLSSEKDAMGYALDAVKKKDGSIDLTPLFTASQGTLGIISEAVIEAEFYNQNSTVLLVFAKTSEDARDIADKIASAKPSQLRLIDKYYLDAATAHGKTFRQSVGDAGKYQTLVYVEFDDFSDRAREKKAKKIAKLLDKQSVAYAVSDENNEENIKAVGRVARTDAFFAKADAALVQLGGGVHVPQARLEEFVTGVRSLEQTLHCPLPVSVDMIGELVYITPELYLKKVSEKQKALKLTGAIAELAQKVGGTVAGSEAEGRLLAAAAYSQLDPAVVALYRNVRDIFDPLRTLNPGVKQTSDAKNMVRQMRSDVTPVVR